MAGQRAALMEEKTEKLQTLSKVLALMYAPLIEKNDGSLCQAFSNRLMDTDKDISYLIITDSKGKVLFADSRDLAAHQYTSFIGKNADRIMSLVGNLGDSSPETMRISVPAMVDQGKRGTITVAFGSRSLAAATEFLKTRLLCAFALAFLAGLLGAILLAKAITRPLKRLITAAHAVEAGNLEVSVPVSSHDEIGDLADSFNRMVIALSESTQKLIVRGNTDSLTGLYNHRYFQDRVRSEITRAERYNRPMSVIMLDIDHFKSLNDTHGHPIGDVVLQQLAKVLIAEARKDIDIITRYGGEEFALILPETELDGALRVGERIRLGIQRQAFKAKDGETIPVTASVGIAQYPIHSVEPEGLIMAADLAMYQSKSMGRNLTTAFSNDIGLDKDQDPYTLYLLLHAADIGSIEAMAAAVDAKEQRSPDFSRAVVSHAVAMARDLGMSEKQQQDFRIAALLHDIGKLAIPNDVLNKKGALDERELETIKRHPTLGYAIVQKSPHLKSMLPGILYHHERWDGGGYPEGLKGEQIPLVARVIAVIDAYHAMMTERPHSIAMTPDQAKEELVRSAGTQFDPRIVDAFLHILSHEEAEREAA